MNIHDTAEKMYSATYNLATALGVLRERLYVAWQACMMLKADDPAVFPVEDLRLRFKTLAQEMSGHEHDGDERAVRATLDRARDEDLQRWAGELFDIAYEIAEIYSQADDE